MEGSNHKGRILHDLRTHYKKERGQYRDGDDRDGAKWGTLPVRDHALGPECFESAAGFITHFRWIWKQAV